MRRGISAGGTWLLARLEPGFCSPADRLADGGASWLPWNSFLALFRTLEPSAWVTLVGKLFGRGSMADGEAARSQANSLLSAHVTRRNSASRISCESHVKAPSLLGGLFHLLDCPPGFLPPRPVLERASDAVGIALRVDTISRRL